MLAGYQKESCKFTGFPFRGCWQAISKMTCTFTGFFFQRQTIRNHVNLLDFPFKGYAGRLSARNHVNLQDFPFRGYASRLSVGNHVDIQDSLRGDADIYQMESYFYERRKICYTYTISRTLYLHLT